MDCNLEIQGTAFVQQKARVYTSGAIPNDEEADVEESGVTKTKTNKKKLPAGTHVFVSLFDPFTQYVVLLIECPAVFIPANCPGNAGALERRVREEEQGRNETRPSSWVPRLPATFCDIGAYRRVVLF